MKKLKLLILPLSALLLTSCIPFIENLFPPASSSSEKPKVVNILPSTDNTYKHPAVESDKNYYKVEFNPDDDYDNTVIGASKDVHFLKSVGDQKLLVVPISFTNPELKNKYNNESVKTALNKAFFGESEDTGWESVASFYHKSSFGKLNITGEVSDIFHSTYTTSELEEMKIDDDHWDQSHYVIEQVYNHMAAQKLKEYDQDKDGFVDAVFFIYLAPVSGDLFWAFQYYWNQELSEDKPGEKPVFDTYGWASYDFMYEDNNYRVEKPAAHTYIHETGHIFGLDDYYDYDGNTAPLGGIDMMDNNIIDHNMYSKYLLNWATPYVPVGDAEIFLRPAESSGDFILINNKWNGHPYDEYILIEYYTPTGLNNHDSMGEGYGKGTNKIKGFNESGVRIYHVDSRIIEMRAVDKSGKAFPYKYRDTLSASDQSFYYDYVASNTPTTSYITNFKRLHLLDGLARPRTWYHTQVLTDNTVLFNESSQEIKHNEWRNYLFSGNTFNDNSTIGYSVLIGAMDEAGVTIKLTAAQA